MPRGVDLYVPIVHEILLPDTQACPQGKESFYSVWLIELKERIFIDTIGTYNPLNGSGASFSCLHCSNGTFLSHIDMLHFAYINEINSDFSYPH